LGVDEQKRAFDVGMWSRFAGQYSDRVRWWRHLAAALFKLPLAAWGLWGCACGVWCAARVRGRA
jgi:hypothetical protein